MTQIEKIRQMSAEELARWLMDEVEQGQFSTNVCNAGICSNARAIAEAEERGEDADRFLPCSDENCIAAAVAYLESEVEEK
ncbi:MAG: hypothetical protein J6B09_06660 [Clostridia bacterium]|nr:hypothetical protein [Clostridia bacterium]